MNWVGHRYNPARHDPNRVSSYGRLVTSGLSPPESNFEKKNSIADH